MVRAAQNVIILLWHSVVLTRAVLAMDAMVPEPPSHREAAPLNVARLQEMALQRNPTLAVASRRIEALQGVYLQAGLYPNPTFGYQGDEIGDEGRAGQQGVMVAQRIVTAGKLGWNRAVVSQEIAAAQQRWQMQRYRVISDVRVAAHEVIAAQRTVELAERLVQLGDDFLLTAQRLFEAREVNRLDVLQASIEANAAKLRLQRARQTLQGQWQQLAAQVGVADLPLTSIEDEWDQHDLTPLAWDETLQRLLQQSPEWFQTAIEIERARAELARQCAASRPDLDLVGSVSYNGASGDTIAGLGVSIPLQLFDRNQGNIVRARAELNAAHEELHRVELMLHRRLAAVFQEYENARATVSRYRDEILPAAGEALTLVGQGYQQGEVGYLDLLTVQRTFFQTNLDFVEAFRDFQVSRTRIDNLLLAGSLEEQMP
jgi:outer membrane protein, heavy metal efflux system